MRCLVGFAVVLATAVASPGETDRVDPYVETYRLRLTWYESDAIQVCEFLPPLNEADSIEVTVRLGQPFQNTSEKDGRRLQVSGTFKRERGCFWLSPIHYSRELPREGQRVMTTIILTPGIEQSLGQGVGTEGLRVRERVVVVTVTPATYAF